MARKSQAFQNLKVPAGRKRGKPKIIKIKMQFKIVLIIKMILSFFKLPLQIFIAL
jgi:hypothetical protein